VTGDSDDDRPGEMTDAQLDQLLEAVGSELLGHVRANADPDRTLIAIMSQIPEGEPGAAPDQNQAALMIRVRSDAYSLTRHLIRGRDLIRAVDRDLARQRAIDRGLARAVELELAREIADAVKLARAVELGIAHAADSDLIDGLARDLMYDLDHDVVLARDLARARDLAAFDGRDLSHARDLARAIDLDLDRSSVIARDLASFIGTQPLDASNADLSDLEIEHLYVLDGVVWTPQTIWPAGIADQVWEHSEEIRHETYQVRFGNAYDIRGLARM
jgi:hypothetical protein